MVYDDFQFLKFDRPEEGVLLITLNRPEVMNATNARLHWELTKIWDVVQNDPLTRVAVVTGAGDRAFSAGGDLAWVETMVGNPEQIAIVKQEAADVVYNMLACDKPIISENAKFTDGHVKLGVAAGDHAAIIWPLLCGMAKAKYYLMTADFIDGKEAERIGLVTFCVPHDELMPKSLAIAKKLSLGSQPAIQNTKKSLNNWMRMAGPIFDTSLGLEMFGFLGADAREGLDAVKNKRAPKFPSAQPKT